MEKKKSLFQRLRIFLFGETVVIQHPFFGKLIDAGSYYEGAKFFAPINKPLEIALNKTTLKLEEKQISFFIGLQDDYSALVAAISPAIERRVAEWLPGYRITNFDKEYILEYLEIPDFREDLPNWTISFWADNDLQHWCTLDMKGMEVEEIMIDG